MSRGDKRIEAALMRRAVTKLSEPESPDDAFERYILSMFDRPIFPHHITELRERPGPMTVVRSPLN